MGDRRVAPSSQHLFPPAKGPFQSVVCSGTRVVSLDDLLQELHMPPRHHRTIDRVVSILESVAREKSGLTLSELAAILGAPKSSVQELVYGLTAAGYLTEHTKRYFLGAAPYVLTLMHNPVAAGAIRHDDIVGVRHAIGLNVVVAIQVGDTYVSIDRASENPDIDFLTRDHQRRPLLSTALGKIILANLPGDELDSYLTTAGRHNPSAVKFFLEELPDIRRTGLAFNRGASITGLYAVGTAIRDEGGHFVAAICVTGTAELDNRLDEVGKRLQCEVSRLQLNSGRLLPAQS